MQGSKLKKLDVALSPLEKKFQWQNENFNILLSFYLQSEFDAILWLSFSVAKPKKLFAIDLVELSSPDITNSKRYTVPSSLEADCASINSLGFDKFNSSSCCSTFSFILTEIQKM